MATKEMTSVGLYVVPKVNLLPPEIGERRAQRRSVALMVVAVGCAGVAVGFVYLGQVSRVSAAKDERTSAQQKNATLRNDRVKLQDVQDKYAAVDADEALLTQAYSQRVMWSRYLHDVSIALPENLWLTGFTGTIATAAPSNSIVAAPVATPSGPVGTLSFTGQAYEYNDLAAWLDRVAKIKGFAGASFSTAAKKPPVVTGNRTLVEFTGSASLTPAAITPHKKPGSR
jgi:Tfp pilus assembly protein PilN